jgi:hypothetical protein
VRACELLNDCHACEAANTCVSLVAPHPQVQDEVQVLMERRGPTVRVSFLQEMAFSAKIPLLVVLVALVCGTASAGRGDRDLSRYCLPLLKNLPDTCGYVLGVVEGDTCESLA